MTEALTRPMEDVEEPREVRSAGSLLRATEIDTRLFGMLVALAVIWLGFHILSGGTFLTARNLWNLSVQTSAVGIMATGMVLVIVTRNIDLSVGSVLAVVGMLMGLAQAEWLPDLWGFDHPLTWVVTLAGGLVIGVLVGGFQGFLVAFGRIPSFIVTLGGLLVWRGVAWASASGRTIAPMDMSFQRIGGGARGSIGATWSWVVGIVACAAVIALLVNGRRKRRRYDFTLRPMWADVAIGMVSCGAIIATVWVSNSYYLPENLARQYAEENGIAWPPGGLQVSLGLPIPVLILIGVALVMTFVATRLRFGRYVFAIGGNPEAADLAGVKSRATVVKTFALMGLLVGVAAAVSIARLNAAVSGLGTTAELYVIAAAVIGGTSLAGGIGTIAGAVLGALIMQSLQSGMVLLGVDAPLQDIVVGAVLVLAVGIDSYTPEEPEMTVTAEQASTVPLVEMRNMYVSFGGVHAVENVSIDLRPGEIHALLGGNGAGKSTLVKALSGAQNADAGEIFVDGEPVTITSPRDAKALGIETIYQTLALADNIDAPGNMFLGRELVNRWGVIDDSAMEDATRKVMKRLNPKFTNFMAPVSSLSGGQRQSVAIARAVHFNARILIMDEPTAALGPAETEQVRALIRQLKAEGLGIIMISHDIHDVFDLADRISVMLQGRLVGTVNKDDVTSDEVLAMIIIGKLPDEVTQAELTDLHG